MMRRTAVLLGGIVLSLPSHPATAATGDPARAIAGVVADELAKDYVFPSKGAAAAALLHRQADAGAYDGESGGALADHLTRDLVMLRDRHVRVRFSDEVLPPASTTGAEQSPAEIAALAAFERRIDYGFARAASLPGNVGYLDLRIFASTAPQRDRVIDAMVDSVSASDAVILDLRANHGGDPDAVARLLSHFLPPKTRVNDFVGRGDGDGKIASSTFTGKVGGSLVTAPLYVLTSARTFSAGEECAYDLQALKRATLVGEVTGGGANPGEFRRIGDHYSIFVPDGRARNPITHTNWDGLGVVPDVAVSSDVALRTAYGSILERLAADASSSEDDRNSARIVREKVRTMDDAAILALPGT